MRKFISKYYHDIYQLELIPQDNGNESIIIDDNLFVHVDNKHMGCEANK